MADENLSLSTDTGGISIMSGNEYGELYLVTITKDGYLEREDGVPQEHTNFICQEGEEKVRVD